MDTIRIFFRDLEPQEVRVQTWSGAYAYQEGMWCFLFEPGRGTLVAFKAKLERWERVHEQG